MHKRPARSLSPRLRSPGSAGAFSPFPADEQGEGDGTWRLNRDRRGDRQPLPARFTLDKPGTCEVMGQRLGRAYTGGEYLLFGGIMSTQPRRRVSMSTLP
jgi:hypothetical protein